MLKCLSVAALLTVLFGAGCNESSTQTSVDAGSGRRFACSPPSLPAPSVAADVAQNPESRRAIDTLSQLAREIRDSHNPARAATFIAPTETAFGLGRSTWMRVLSMMSSEDATYYLDSLACDISSASPIQVDNVNRLVLLEIQASSRSGARSPRQVWFSFASDNFGFFPPR